MIRVVLVDDQAVVRMGFRAILESEDDIEVVGEASTGTDAVRVVRRLRPDVVCMDVRMPGGDGIAATRALAGPDVAERFAVLVITTFDLDDYVFGALEAGAGGFLLKDAEPDAVVAAVRGLAAGEGAVAPAITRRVIAEFARRRAPAPADPAVLDLLTTREREILLLLTRGRSNAEIAGELHLETSTVKTHLGRLMGKIGARDRVQAVVWAFEHGLARG